jgi:cytochrome oxidase Cu insertion factor (SCO1/SenC/PrrC family)
MRDERLNGPERWALWALAAIIATTVAWWAAALWPLPAATPEWVIRARAACFGTARTGLPNAGGWILLIGTPISLALALMVIAGREVRGGLAALRASGGGRAAVLAVAALLVVLAGAASARVASASGFRGFGAMDPTVAALAPDRLVRLDREAPRLDLVDQHGERVRLEAFAGRPVLLTFAYGKCETVCPVIVHSVRKAAEELEELDPAVLVVTVDPWRDTPRRLPHIAASWRLGPDAHLLGGDVATVEATLDAWAVARSRDPRTGEIAHPSLVYLIDHAGRVAFALTGDVGQIVGAARRL